MSDPPSYDQDLLSRLNALKKSSISTLDQTKPQLSPQPTPNIESDLSARLRSLRNASSSPSPSPVSKAQLPASLSRHFATFPSVPPDTDPLRDPHSLDIDDKTLDELLADLGPDDQWKLDPDDPKDIQKLLDEAKNSLPDEKVTRTSQSESNGDQDRKSEVKEASRSSKNPRVTDIDFLVFEVDHDTREDKKDEGKANEKDPKSEDEEVDDIVRRMLDELSFEKANTPPFAERSPDQAETDNDGKGLSLPSAPSALPTPSPQPVLASKKSQEFESDIFARLSALKGLSTNDLGLPSAPSFKPSDQPFKGVVKKPTFTDDEIDSWCVICSEDATVRCIGCENDLYCATCWKEGHLGPDAGMEEKGHKWAKYRKPN